ncbi:S8 family peptidase [uncultured Mucilaginibacter sp.]|uniref:S8 family peptidase n=1 Tax=uncultured Mucilaginibacter sp. TaxID=797541 RepID=UPI0025DAC606|nr:S8 family peptidase [uncultured Mucilaginibacter sp.]
MINFYSIKRLLLAGMLLCTTNTFAQAPAKPKPNWQNLDLKADGMFGISTEKAYNELLKDKKPSKVIVAVIDGGVDVNHEDLKDVIWSNSKEIAGNGIDDDKNGYADDVHGWNFIGSAKGNLQYDNTELTRLLKKYWMKFAYATPETLKGEELKAYNEHEKHKAELQKQRAEATQSLQNISGFKQALEAVLQAIGIENPTYKDVMNFVPRNQVDNRVREIVLRMMPEYKDFKDFKKNVVDEAYQHYNEKLNYHLNMDYEARDLVGDNYENSNEHFYGNNDVTGPDADHGSHVAGIIAALRENNLGIKGVANNVAIMSVRTVPNGDERDKDVANAIRYAANNGAKVINMSFGKPYSWDKKVVDEAVKYAVSKDVLLIHAAGNDNENTDQKIFYPNRNYEDKSGTAEAWIEVGASGFIDDKTLKAPFSNYGKNTVDVFAPGVAIYSTTPNSEYANHDGTSMAAPVVSGLAALIRSYYPSLTAAEVKEVILKSVVKIDHKVNYKVGSKERSIAFADLCKTGGVVNAYNALKLAAAKSAAK